MFAHPDDDDEEDSLPLLYPSLSPSSLPYSLRNASASPPLCPPGAPFISWERFRQLEADVEMLKRAHHLLVGEHTDGKGHASPAKTQGPVRDPSRSITQRNGLRPSNEDKGDKQKERLRTVVSTASFEDPVLGSHHSLVSSSSSAVGAGQPHISPLPRDQKTEVVLSHTSKTVKKIVSQRGTAQGSRMKNGSPLEGRDISDNAKAFSIEETGGGRLDQGNSSNENGNYSNEGEEKKDEKEQNWQEGHAEIELRRLVPHLSPGFSCSHTDCLLLLAAIRQGGALTGGMRSIFQLGGLGGGGRNDLSLQERLQITEAEKRTLQKSIEVHEASQHELRNEIASLKERLKLVKKEAKQSSACVEQKLDEVRRQLLLEEGRSEKLRVQNRKVEAELEQLRSRIRGSY